MNDFINDLRYAARTLIRAPGFTIVAVLTLALGIGANTAVFSVVNTLLLQPLPFDEPGRVVMLWQQNTETGFDQSQAAWADYCDWKEKNTTLESLGFVINMTAASRNFLLRTGAELPSTDVRAMGPGTFKTLGIPLLEGRDFKEADDRNVPYVTIINDVLKDRFFPDESPIGQTIQLRGNRGAERTIIGVVGSVRNYSGESVDQPEMYSPFKQSYLVGSEVGPVMLIRVEGDPTSLVPAIRHAVVGPDPRQEVLVRFVSAMLLVVGIAACLIPGWNAMRINPLDALRHE